MRKRILQSLPFVLGIAVALACSAMPRLVLAGEPGAVESVTAEPASLPPSLTVPGEAGMSPAGVANGSSAENGPIAPVAAGKVAPAAFVAQATGVGHTDVLGIRLRIDGNLAGIVTVLDPDGKVVPAHARVSLVRDGKPIQSVRSEDTGAFQMLAVEPGLYSIVAVGRGGMAALTIRVIPFDDSSIPSDDLVKLALVPSDDLQQSGDEDPGEAGEDVPPAFPPQMAAPMYGGGGGLGALAGLAGLAGLGGGGGGFGGGGGGPASSNTP